MPDAAPAVFRLSRLTYVVVLFLYVGAVPVALTATTGVSGPGVGPQTLVFLIPLLATLFVARTATIVDHDGITVRAVAGRRTLPWDRVRGLEVAGSTVYAVVAEGRVRLPCVNVATLAAVARASGGRLPELAEPKPKQPPARQRRR